MSEMHPTESLAPVFFDGMEYARLRREVERSFLNIGMSADYLRQSAVMFIDDGRQTFLASLDTGYCAETLRFFNDLCAPRQEIPEDSRRGMRNQIGRVVMSNFERFASLVDSDDDDVAEAARHLVFESADAFGLSNDETEQSQQVAFLVEHMQDHALSGGVKAVHTLERIVRNRLLQCCTDERQRTVCDIVYGLAQERTTRAVGAGLLASITTYMRRAGGTAWPTDALQQSLSEKSGMDFADLARAWAEGHRYSSLPDYEALTIEMVFDLEEKNPGICSALHDRFGISNFFRCTVEVWEDMYNNIDNKDAQYGIMLYPEYDKENNAFYAIKDKVAKLHKKLKSKEVDCLLRVYECASVDDAERAFTDAEDIYERQLEFAIGCAHGEPSNMMFAQYNNGKSCERLTYQMLESAAAQPAGVRRLQKIARQFAADAKLLLYSCSTGEMSTGQCMGEVLARLLGVLVLAPTLDKEMESMDARRKPNGGIDVGINFGSTTPVNAFDGRIAGRVAQGLGTRAGDAASSPL